MIVIVGRQTSLIQITVITTSHSPHFVFIVLEIGVLNKTNKINK